MWTPNNPEIMPQPGVNRIHLNRKKTSQTAVQKTVVVGLDAERLLQVREQCRGALVHLETGNCHRCLYARTA